MKETVEMLPTVGDCTSSIRCESEELTLPLWACRPEGSGSSPHSPVVASTASSGERPELPMVLR